ncbi:MAG: imidazolonepropionase, partial [Alistipes sp.]|nr:imidazolonepropionase [Alistipes sp.]
MNLLVKNIGMLVGIDESGRLKVEGKAMAEIETLANAWLLTDGERIKDYGTMDTLPSAEGCDVLDAEGGWLFPSFCDSHTHIVFAGSREQEFLDKINGLSYEEIAKRGGGILNSADRLH